MSDQLASEYAIFMFPLRPGVAVGRRHRSVSRASWCADRAVPFLFFRHRSELSDGCRARVRSRVQGGLALPVLRGSQAASAEMSGEYESWAPTASGRRRSGSMLAGLPTRAIAWANTRWSGMKSPTQ